MKIFSISIFLLLLVSCQTSTEMNWDGKWVDEKGNWGLKMEDGNIYEWDHGKYQKEGTYKIVPMKEMYILVIHDKDETITFPFTVIDEDKILIEIDKRKIPLTRHKEN